MECIEWWTLKCRILVKEMEGRWQLVDLYRGQRSDLGNFWCCQPWEEHYWYDLLEDSCVQHDSACTPWSIGNSDWMHRLLMTWDVTDTGWSCKSFCQYRFGAMLHAWFGLDVLRLCIGNRLESIDTLGEIPWWCGCVLESFDFCPIKCEY